MSSNSMHMYQPILRPHKYSIKYSFCKFLAVSRKLPISIIANSYCISFDLFIPVINFCKQRVKTNQ